MIINTQWSTVSECRLYQMETWRLASCLPNQDCTSSPFITMFQKCVAGIGERGKDQNAQKKVNSWLTLHRIDLS